MKRSSKIYLEDILESMEFIEEFLGNLKIDDLKKDEKTLSAIVRKFEIIGEASRHVSESLKEKHKDVPWKSMVGMRDRLIHAYFGVDCALVWSAIKEEIPKLKPKIQYMLDSLQTQ